MLQADTESSVGKNDVPWIDIHSMGGCKDRVRGQVNWEGWWVR